MRESHRFVRPQAALAAWVVGMSFGVTWVVSAPRPALSEEQLSPVQAQSGLGAASVPDRSENASWGAAPSRDHAADVQAPAVAPQSQQKRGIRPPWRENAIPELRRQPGQHSKALTS